MKVICVTILLVCVLAATFSNWLIIASFNINQGYIAKALCVNRNKPHSTCNGHCYLNKQLTKEEKPESNGGGTSKEKFEVQLFFAAAPGFETAINNNSVFHYTAPQFFAQQLYISSVFHPPGLS